VSFAAFGGHCDSSTRPRLNILPTAWVNGSRLTSDGHSTTYAAFVAGLSWPEENRRGRSLFRILRNSISQGRV